MLCLKFPGTYPVRLGAMAQIASPNSLNSVHIWNNTSLPFCGSIHPTQHDPVHRAYVCALREDAYYTSLGHVVRGVGSGAFRVDPAHLALVVVDELDGRRLEVAQAGSLGERRHVVVDVFL